MEETLPQAGITDKIRAFTLKKNEITMAAADEVRRMKSQLLFVSMKDYHDLLQENIRLKQEVNELKAKLKNKTFITKRDAAFLLNVSYQEAGNLLKGVAKKKVRNRYRYDKEEILKLV